MNTPTNILFITADQWRGDCLSAVDHPCLKTPNLDRLAADGVLFKQHFAQATPCGPSRASLYTGMYLQNHRSVNNGTPLDARHTNVALEARKAGYNPLLFGYTDISVDPRQCAPGDPRLQTYEGVLPGLTPVMHVDDRNLPWLADLKTKGYVVSEDLHGVFKPKEINPTDKRRGVTFAPAQYKKEDSYTAFLTNEVIKHLSVGQDQPWFIHLSYLSPHPPFVAPEPYHAMYDPEEVPKPVRASTIEDEASQHPYLDYFLHNQRGGGVSYGYDSKNNLELDDVDVLQARATYYGMISEVDAQMGRLFDYLKEIDAYDNTLIVFTSDHGEQLGDHWQFAKYIYFDQSFHVPLIVRQPKSKVNCSRNHQVNSFTESIDIMPTILECIGVETPHQCDGESLIPFCSGNIPENWRKEAHWEIDFRNFRSDNDNTILGLKPDECACVVIRGKRYKYIHFIALPPLFFDLEKDPNELHNLIDHPKYQSLILDYTQKMLSWRLNHADRVMANLRLTTDGLVEEKPPRR
jgi:arylsulfatase A-like enzyme